MRRALLASVLLTCLALPAAAQTVLVRSGEHGSFTRIVVDFANRPDWRIEQTEDGVRLFAGRVDFDLSQVYRRISRERLQSLTQVRPGVLDIVLGCRCVVETDALPNGWLVLDVMAGEPKDVSRGVELPDHGELEPLPLFLLPRGIAGPENRDGLLRPAEGLARTERLRGESHLP